jgi:hypothetical protein
MGERQCESGCAFGSARIEGAGAPRDGGGAVPSRDDRVRGGVHEVGGGGGGASAEEAVAG